MRTLSRFAPPLVLMGVIFALSAQPSLDSGLAWDMVLRKAAHMTEFGLLWFLWWRALGYGNRLVPLAIAVAYAITDEIHQTFVHDRHGSPVDVLIDAAGMGLAMLAVRHVQARRRRSDSVLHSRYAPKDAKPGDA